MIQLLRITGFLLVIFGALLILTWLVEPLRALWPLLVNLPIAIQIGLIAGSIGLLLLLASLIYERWRERDADRRLREDR